jgi:hypothetical protein
MVPTGRHVGRGGGPPFIGLDPTRRDRRGPAQDRRRMPRAAGPLAVLFILLAPWGGPCDRSSRPADPTSSPSLICGRTGESPPFTHGGGAHDDLLDMSPDILEDEEDGEGSEAQDIAGATGPRVPPSPTMFGATGCDPQHDHSGRSARSPFLRC